MFSICSLLHKCSYLNGERVTPSEIMETTNLPMLSIVVKEFYSHDSLYVRYRSHNAYLTKSYTPIYFTRFIFLYLRNIKTFYE